MMGASGNRPPRDERRRSSRRSAGRSAENRYQFIHTSLLMLGTLLFVASIIITVIMVVMSVL
ncbi:hypothetical protein [Halocatena marina]|uniref:DUF4044 domain-containing protein n=1 Tax=Halocatena marina TaxID=2934937 RepID=A0ABD5YUG6_9EURY|nr:hypothetical protein [Halocatena marina]